MEWKKLKRISSGQEEDFILGFEADLFRVSNFKAAERMQAESYMERKPGGK